MQETTSANRGGNILSSKGAQIASRHVNTVVAYSLETVRLLLLVPFFVAI